MGTLAAGIAIERQPDECGRIWPDLVPRAGESMQSLGRRYVEYVRGPINERVRNCYQYNENQRLGLMGLPSGGQQ